MRKNPCYDPSAIYKVCEYVYLLNFFMTQFLFQYTEPENASMQLYKMYNFIQNTHKKF